MDLTTTTQWQALESHFNDVGNRQLRELFADDTERAARLTARAGDLVLDYSKHRVTDETMRLLLGVARAAGVEARRDAMFAGEHINTTEDRAVLHIALRLPEGERLSVDGQDVAGDVHAVLGRMGDLSDRIRVWLLGRCHRGADPGRRQHRHRRFGLGTGHGHRGPGRLCLPRI